MSLNKLIFFGSSAAFDERFAWDGYTMNYITDTTGPDRSRRFIVDPSADASGMLEDVTAEDENLAADRVWSNPDNPELFDPATDPFFNWNGGTSSDYTYFVTVTLTGAATNPDNFFAPGSHAASDLTGGLQSRLELSPIGTPGSWEIEIAVTHTPSGLVRTGILNFEYL